MGKERGITFRCAHCGALVACDSCASDLPFAGLHLFCTAESCGKRNLVRLELDKKIDTGLTVGGRVAILSLAFAPLMLEGVATSAVAEALTFTSATVGAYHVGMGAQQEKPLRCLQGSLFVLRSIVDVAQLQEIEWIRYKMRALRLGLIVLRIWREQQNPPFQDDTDDTWETIANRVYAETAQSIRLKTC